MMRPVFVLCLLAAPAAHAGPSQFGCANTQFAASASIEGREGVFYRVQSDLRLQHPMDDAVVAQLARLARVLAEQGTTLVYVNVPTKGQAMPQYLPPEAAAYGHDPFLMQANYQDVTDRLNAAGVAAPDLMSAMLEAGPDEKVFFQADFHWTPDGARLAAKAIGEMIRALPAYAGVTPVEFISQPAEPEIAFSGLRRELQTYCKETLPEVKATTWVTTRATGDELSATDIFADATPAEPAEAAEGEALDIFGTGSDEASLVLVGTSFSDSSINNFAGFLSEHAGIEVVNYAITGGNQFGSMTSYLTSREFAENRPTFLVWENPIYNSLAQFGPVPMDELIVAAGPTCAIATETTVEGNALSASFRPGQLKPEDAFLFDQGGEGARIADVTFETAAGIRRTIRIERSDRLRATGRFFLALEPYWHPDLVKVEVSFDRALTEASALTLCPTRKGDAS